MMDNYILKAKEISFVTHDVIKIVVEKPVGYNFVPGEATEISINQPLWVNEKRPFTFTCLPSDDHLEFIIKTYPEHKGVTNELLKLKVGDELKIGDSWGAIKYKGPGLFIAGGAGITPFISIFRKLAEEDNLQGNRLIFANKRKEDIILETELRYYLGNDFINILSAEKVSGHHHGYITENIIRESLPFYDENIYVCGPPPMMDGVSNILSNIGVTQGAVIVEL